MSGFSSHVVFIYPLINHYQFIIIIIIIIIIIFTGDMTNRNGGIKYSRVIK